MSLRSKISLIVAASMLGLILLLYGIASTVLKGVYEKAELQVVQEEVEQVRQSLAQQSDDLESLTRDWAFWDDTYNFVQTGSSDYIFSNLTDSTYVNNHIDIAVFLDSLGSIAYSNAYDHLSERQVPITKKQLDDLLSDRFDRVTAIHKPGVTGVMLLADTPVIVTALPVLHSSGEGEPAGRLLFIRYIDRTLLSQIEKLVGYGIELQPASGPYLSTETMSVLSALQPGSDSTIQPVNQEWIESFLVVNDLAQKPAAVLRLESPRTFFQQGMAAIRLMMVGLALLGIAYLALTWLLLEKLVLSRLARVSEDLSGVVLSGNLSSRLRVQGSDELAKFARNINHMLSALEQSQLELSRTYAELKERWRALTTVNESLQVEISERRRAEDQLRLRSAAIEAAANAVVIANLDGCIQWVNPAFTTLTGFSLEDAAGQNPRLLKSGFQDETYYERMWATISNGTAWHGEIINRRKDGQLYTEEMTIAPVRNQDGLITHYIAIKQDVTERRKREREMETIARISAALRDTLKRAEMLPIIMDQLMDLFAASGFEIMLRDPQTGEAVVELSGGEWVEYKGERYTSSLGLGSYVMNTGKPYLNNDAASDQLFFHKELLHGLVSLACVPMIAQGKTIGTLLLGCKQYISDEALQQLIAVADISASAFQRSELHEQMLQQTELINGAYEATIEGWARAMEMRDRETQGHTLRVVQMAIKLGRALGFSPEVIGHLRRGALLHDIGKMGIPDNILRKPGPLTAEETVIMRQHTWFAYEMLKDIKYLEPSLDVPLYHHERWDGSGYPFGLVGEHIPLMARLFAVVDVWDALTSDRSYRKAWSKEDARNYIVEQSGKQFDPAVVSVFFQEELFKAIDISIPLIQAD